MLKRYWELDQRRGPVPNLERSQRQEIEDLTHPAVRGLKPEKGTLLGVEQTDREKRQQEIKARIESANAMMATYVSGESTQAFEQFIDSMKMAVARHPSHYRQWLKEQGYLHYAHFANEIKWDDWLEGPAVKTWGSLFGQQLRPAHSIESLHYAPAPLPKIPFEEAERGYDAWQARVGAPREKPKIFSGPTMERVAPGTMDPRDMYEGYPVKAMIPHLQSLESKDKYDENEGEDEMRALLEGI